MNQVSDPQQTPLGFPIIAALFEGGLVLLALAIGWLLGVRPLDLVEWSPRLWWACPLSVLPPLGLLVLCVYWPVPPFAAVLRTLDQQVAPMFKGCSLVDLAVIAALAGLGEEMLFRGVLQSAVANWISDRLAAGLAGRNLLPWANGVAVVSVAVLFGVAHFVNLGYALLATLIGLYLGWLYLATGNLAVPIFAHGFYDFLAMVYLMRIRRPL